MTIHCITSVNRSRSLYLCIHNIHVAISINQNIAGNDIPVLETTVQAGEAAVLPFEVTDGWGEYTITFLRPTRNDDITISNIGIYTRTEEATGINDLQSADSRFDAGGEIVNSKYFDLQGRMVQNPQHGIFLSNGKLIKMR